MGPGDVFGAEAPPDDDGGSPLVRPYAITGGRTRPKVQFAMEALVTAERSEHDTYGLSPEQKSIVSLCQNSQSIAEIAAHMRVPLGVARVLVGDLADIGLVRVYEPADDDELGLELLERVLSGLRKL